MGRVYHQYLKHPNGSVFFITISSLKPSNTISQSFRLIEAEKLLQKLSNFANINSTPSYLDDIFLAKHLNVGTQLKFGSIFFYSFFFNPKYN